MNHFQVSVLGFFLILCSSVSYGQCSFLPTEWEKTILSIENADKKNAEKISDLLVLKKKFIACNLRRDSIYARIVHRLGDLYRLEGNFEDGISFTREAVSINKTSHASASPSFLAHSYYNLGLYHYLLGLPVESDSYYDSCISVAMNHPSKVFLALMAFEKKAFRLYEIGDYERSIAVGQQGLDVARKRNDSEYTGLLLVQLAQSKLALGKISEARTDISEAMSILRKNKFEEYLANAYSVYANVLSRSKEINEAVRYYEKAYLINHKYGNIVQSARDLNDLAYLYDRDLKNLQKAVATYRKAVSVASTYDLPYLNAITQNNIGLAYWRNGKFNEALDNYQKGLNDLPVNFKNPDVKTNPGEVQLRQVSNDYVAAALLWNKGDALQDLFKETHDTTLLDLALKCYRAGDRLIDQMRWKHQGEQSKLFWRDRTKEWYANAIGACYLSNDADQLFYFMEKSRAVLLNDRLSELGAKNELPASERDTERNLRLKLNAARQTNSSRKEVWMLEDRLDKFIKGLETKYPAYFLYKYDTTVMTIVEVQKKLDTDQVWIGLFNAGENIFAIVITRDKRWMRKLTFSGHEDVARQLLRLSSSKVLINSNYNGYVELSRKFYENVFAPLDIRAQRIVISQDEYFIPYEILKPDAGTPSLLHNFAIAYAYSAKVFYRPHEELNAPAALLSVAPVRYAEQLRLGDLKGADLSLKHISDNGINLHALLNEDATKQSFIHELPKYPVVHIYSHAVADSSGTEPKLFLYDSAVSVSTLNELGDLRSRLVVLLACNTSVGTAVKGEGVLSLARAFAATGIPSTISSLWEINNEATYLSAELFYKELLEGLPTDVALQRAKLKLIGQRQEFELPYYYGGIILIGPPCEIDLAKGHNDSSFVYWVVGGSSLLIIISLVFFALRRRSLN